MHGFQEFLRIKKAYRYIYVHLRAEKSFHNSKIITLELTLPDLESIIYQICGTPTYISLIKAQEIIVTGFNKYENRILVINTIQIEKKIP